MVAFESLGEWLNGSGWPNAITTVGTASPGVSCEDKTCLLGAGYVWCLCVHVRVCFDYVLVLCSGLCVPIWKNST